MALRILTFDSVHHALKAERVLRGAGFDIVAVNVPRRLSSDCGVALEFDAAIETQIIEVMTKDKIAYKGIYNESDQ
ncbi:MAG: DUF3343 domain-containing protein [Actinomycetota bacterium]